MAVLALNRGNPINFDRIPAFYLLNLPLSHFIRTTMAMILKAKKVVQSMKSINLMTPLLKNSYQ